MPAKQSLKVVTLEKRATIEVGAEILTRISEALAASDRVLINLSHVESADLTTVQLLYAAAREAINRTKELGFTGSVPDSVRQALENGGFCKQAPTDARRLSDDLLDLNPQHDQNEGFAQDATGEPDHG